MRRNLFLVCRKLLKRFWNVLSVGSRERELSISSFEYPEINRVFGLPEISKLFGPRKMLIF